MVKEASKAIHGYPQAGVSGIGTQHISHSHMEDSHNYVMELWHNEKLL